MANARKKLNLSPGGYFEAPSALPPNLKLLTHAELCLVLLACKHKGQAISDDLWEECTGLNPRMKQHAVKGLDSRGCLHVEGRGNTAKLQFDREAWRHYAAHAERSKPRTHGRRAVDPKPKQQVDPECRERGCGLLRSRGETGLSSDAATCDTKPVSNYPAGSGVPIMMAAATSSPSVLPLSTLLSSPRQKQSSPVAATQITKPVSQLPADPETLWAASLAVLRDVFPIVGLAFLALLVAKCCSLFSIVTDSELAGAIRVAWNLKRGWQECEGLFLFTVPDALRAIRAGEIKPDSPLFRVAESPGAQKSVARQEASPPFSVDDVREFVAGNRAKCWEAGFREIALALEALDIGQLYGDLEQLESKLTAIEATMIDQLRSNAGEPESIHAEIEASLKPYVGKMTEDQLTSMRGQFRDRLLLEWAKLPRLSLYYL